MEKKVNKSTKPLGSKAKIDRASSFTATESSDYIVDIEVKKTPFKKPDVSQKQGSFKNVIFMRDRYDILKDSKSPDEMILSDVSPQLFKRLNTAERQEIRDVNKGREHLRRTSSYFKLQEDHKLSLVRKMSLVRRVHENDEITVQRVKFVRNQSNKMRESLAKSLSKTIHLNSALHSAMDIDKGARRSLASMNLDKGQKIRLAALDKSKRFPSIVERSQKDWEK